MGRTGKVVCYDPLCNSLREHRRKDGGSLEGSERWSLHTNSLALGLFPHPGVSASTQHSLLLLLSVLLSRGWLLFVVGPDMNPSGDWSFL